MIIISAKEWYKPYHIVYMMKTDINHIIFKNVKKISQNTLFW